MDWKKVEDEFPEEDSLVLCSGFCGNDLTRERWYVVARVMGLVFYEESTGDDLLPPTHWTELKEIV